MQESILKTKRVMKLLQSYQEIQEMQANPNLWMNGSSEQTKSFLAGFEHAVNIIMGQEHYNDEEE